MLVDTRRAFACCFFYNNQGDTLTVHELCIAPLFRPIDDRFLVSNALNKQGCSGKSNRCFCHYKNRLHRARNSAPELGFEYTAPSGYYDETDHNLGCPADSVNSRAVDSAGD